MMKAAYWLNFNWIFGQFQYNKEVKKNYYVTQ